MSRLCEGNKPTYQSPQIGQIGPNFFFILIPELRSDPMDSPTALSRYIPQNSKKRVFLGGSSSSGRADVEVLEVPPPATPRSSKPKSSKQKEVICHEIIDVDMEEDCDADALIMEIKGKKVSSGPSVGGSSLPKEEFGNDILTSNDGAVVLSDSTIAEDFNSNFLYGEDEWIESYYDDIIYDDNPNLESHFDHMDIPPGVEAPFPWFPSSPRNDTKVPTSSTSAYPITPLHSDGGTISPSLSSSPQHAVIMEMDEYSSWKQMNAPNKPSKKEKLLSKLMESSQKSLNSSSSMHLAPQQPSMAQKHWKESWRQNSKSKRKSHASHFSSYASHYSHHFPPPPPPALFPGSISGGGSHPCPIMPPGGLGAGNSMPVWQDLPLDMLDSSGYMNGGSFSIWEQNFANNNVTGASPAGGSFPTKAGPVNVEEILQKFESFKRFDTVEDHSDHHYSKNTSLEQPPKNWAKRIQEEWRILENDLPDEIFVRVYESRMDLLRAVIIGAEGTPYHDGLFFFDVFFPSNYPKVPPHVYYHSGGLRINPNLYNCGKVCLSLLNTWRGSGKEKWIPGVSTMLQVLVSIQGLILNAKPYFNEPGYESTSGTRDGELRSLEYNERTFLHSLRTMVYSMRRPPKYFEDYVYGYFCKHARDILASCKAYLEGVQVGCLVKGGVQDVDESDKKCSVHFKGQLAIFITSLVNTFTGIGAKDCEEFLSLAKKENGPPTAGPPGSSAWAHNYYN